MIFFLPSRTLVPASMDLDASLLHNKRNNVSTPSPYALSVLPPAWMIAFHCIALGTEGFALAWSGYDIMQRARNGETNKYAFGSMYVFLTVWNITLHALFFLLSIVVSTCICRELRDAAESRDWADRAAIDHHTGRTDQA